MPQQAAKRERKDKFSGVKYRHVIDQRSGEVVVLEAERPRSGVLDQSAIFYNPDVHKGHIVCPDCEVAGMIHIDAYTQGGNNIQVRNHFKKANGAAHANGCISDLRAEEGSDPSPDDKDYSKGPVIFLNTLHRNAREAFFNSASGQREFKPSLVIRDEEGKIRLTNADLADRERFTAKTPADLFRIMKRLSPERLKDAQIIHGDTATAWRKFLIRHSKPSDGPQCSGRGSFNAGTFARFIALADDLLHGERHPVMLHFNASARQVRSDMFKGKPEVKYTLPAFTMPDTVNGKGSIRVVPLVCVTDPAAFDTVRAGGDLFALSRPYLKAPRHDATLRYMIFNIDQASHIKPMAVNDLASAVGTRIKERAPN